MAEHKDTRSRISLSLTPNEMKLMSHIPTSDRNYRALTTPEEANMTPVELINDHRDWTSVEIEESRPEFLHSAVSVVGKFKLVDPMPWRRFNPFLYPSVRNKLRRNIIIRVYEDEDLEKLEQIRDSFGMSSLTEAFVYCAENYSEYMKKYGPIRQVKVKDKVEGESRQVCVRLPLDYFHQFSEMARHRGCSVGRVCREILMTYHNDSEVTMVDDFEEPVDDFDFDLDKEV